MKRERKRRELRLNLFLIPPLMVSKVGMCFGLCLITWKLGLSLENHAVLGHRSWDQRQEREEEEKENKYPNCIKWVCFFGLWHEHSTLCSALIGHAKKERRKITIDRLWNWVYCSTHTQQYRWIWCSRVINMGFSMRVSLSLERKDRRVV